MTPVFHNVSISSYDDLKSLTQDANLLFYHVYENQADNALENLPTCETDEVYVRVNVKEQPQHVRLMLIRTSPIEQELSGLDAWPLPYIGALIAGWGNYDHVFTEKEVPQFVERVRNEKELMKKAKEMIANSAVATGSEEEKSDVSLKKQ